MEGLKFRTRKNLSPQTKSKINLMPYEVEARCQHLPSGSGNRPCEIIARLADEEAHASGQTRLVLPSSSRLCCRSGIEEAADEVLADHAVSDHLQLDVGNGNKVYLHINSI